MKKLFGAIMVALLTVFSASCGDDDDDDNPVTANTGVYKVEITQSGDLDKFSIYIDIGADEYGGLYEDATNQYVGLICSLEDEEAKKTSYSFHTNNKGGAICADLHYFPIWGEETGMINTTVSLLKNGKVLTSKEYTITEEYRIALNSSDYE